MGTMKVRLDQLVVDRGFATSKTKAQAIIMAGHVRLPGSNKTPKPGLQVSVDCEIDVAQTKQAVSRGYDKLSAVADKYRDRFVDAVVADVGSSTGGFTQLALELGARRVLAFDVGRGLMATPLRDDPRVDLREGTNIRYFEPSPDERVDLFVVDVSFISVTKFASVLATMTRAGGIGFVMIKPQFELSRKEIPRGGVVTDLDDRCAAIRSVWDEMTAAGFVCSGILPAAVTGKKGNQEFFLIAERI